MPYQPPDPSRIVHQVSELEMFTIYDHPLDAPGYFVVRRWVMRPGQEPYAAPSASMTDTLDEARALVPPGLVRLARQPDDDPVVVETWI